MWDKIKSLLGSAAPLIGTVIGGPAGGAVAGMVASALGVDSSPEAIERALINNPDALLEIKKLELENAQEFKRLAIEEGRLALDEKRAELADTQNAREQHKDHWMPSALVLILALMVSGMFTALFFGEPSESYAQVLIMIAGTVLGAFGTGVAFWLGSSKGSSDKSKQLKPLGG